MERLTNRIQNEKEMNKLNLETFAKESARE